MTALLPLFPLEVVLFPGMPLALHIFEPRYKQMIGRCLERSEPFGVVLESQGARAAVGCSAEVTKVLRRYPDGRLDLLSEGRRRFRIERTKEDEPWLEGEVEWLEDQDPGSAEGRARVLELYRHTYWAHAQGLPLATLEAAPVLSWVVGRSELLGLPDRQKLLEMPGEGERLLALGNAIERLEPFLRRVAGNGQG